LVRLALAVDFRAPDRGPRTVIPIRPVDVLAAGGEERDFPVQPGDEVQIDARSIEIRPADSGAAGQGKVNVIALDSDARAAAADEIVIRVAAVDVGPTDLAGPCSWPSRYKSRSKKIGFMNKDLLGSSV